MTAAVAETKALDDVFKPRPYDSERIPHMAQCLGNLYGCLEQFAYHVRYMRQSGENADVISFLDAIDPDAEALARKIAEKFAAAYSDLEPLLKDQVAHKDFVPFTKSLAVKEEKIMPEPVTPAAPPPPDKSPEPPPEKKEETKGMPSYHRKAIEGASDHLDKLSSHDGLEEEDRKACYHHAKALSGVLEDDEERRPKEGEEDVKDDEDEEMTPEEQKTYEQLKKSVDARQKILDGIGQR